MKQIMSMKKASTKQRKNQTLNASYNSDFYHGQKHTSASKLKTCKELVHMMISNDPEKERMLNEIEDKPRILLTKDDLELEASLLREKLKVVNRNLDRIVKKAMVSNQIVKARENPSLKSLIDAKGGGDGEEG